MMIQTDDMPGSSSLYTNRREAYRTTAFSSTYLAAVRDAALAMPTKGTQPLIFAEPPGIPTNPLADYNHN